ncbi:hypothetical protein [Yinghuangia soli]|uniref:Uncharacterized protein n=1 Tax=Yinghuangia soli TaxID=2908204 RepID=A0AA41PZP4_9ACTN|nr:hypothetical protein [Yinghuangia soli]MCF2528626.1 hypothetical protein [Yinghuangia soli]
MTETKSSRTFQWAAAGTAWGLLVLAGGLGYVGYTILHDDGPAAARPGVAAAAPGGRPSPPPQPGLAAAADGTHEGDLPAGLLPPPSGWVLGADRAQHGRQGLLPRNVVEASLQRSLDFAAMATGKRGRSAAEVLDAQGWSGTAFRTYRSVTNSMDVQIELTRMSPSAVRENGESMRRVAELAKVELLDPGVLDADAWCMAGPGSVLAGTGTGSGEGGLGELACNASVGDIQVKVYATGTEPLRQNAVFDLLKAQVDRLRKGGPTA